MKGDVVSFVEAAKVLGVSRSVTLLKPNRYEPSGHHTQFAQRVFLSEHADARNVLVELDAYRAHFINGFPNIALNLKDGQVEALTDFLKIWPNAPKKWAPILLGDENVHWTGEALKTLIRAGAELHPGAWKLILKNGDFPLFEEHVSALLEAGVLIHTTKVGRHSFFLEHVFRSLFVAEVDPEHRRPFLKLLLSLDADPAPLLEDKMAAFITPEERTLLSNALLERNKRHSHGTTIDLVLETELDLV